MSEEARSVYVYDLDPKKVTVELIHDWLSQSSTKSNASSVEKVTLRYDSVQKQTCFRAVMSSVELANAVLNHLDGQVFISGPARILSTVYSKSINTSLDANAALKAGEPALAASVLSSLKPTSGSGAKLSTIALDPSSLSGSGGEEDAYVSDALPHNHLVHAHYQLMPPLAQWADSLKEKAGTAPEGSGGEGASSSAAAAAAASASLLQKVEALAALQLKLSELTLLKNSLREQVEAKTKANTTDAEGDAKDKEGDAAEDASAVAAAADGDSDKGGATVMTAAVVDPQSALRADLAARLVEVKGYDPIRCGDATRLVGLVTRCVGPIVSAERVIYHNAQHNNTTSSIGTSLYGGGYGGGGASMSSPQSIVLEMAFAEDAAALVALGTMRNLSSSLKESSGNKVGGGLPSSTPPHLHHHLPAMKTVMATAGVPSSSATPTADAGTLLSRLLKTLVAGGDGEGVGGVEVGGGDPSISYYRERLAILQSMGGFTTPMLRGAYPHHHQPHPQQSGGGVVNASYVNKRVALAAEKASSAEINTLCDLMNF